MLKELLKAAVFWFVGLKAAQMCVVLILSGISSTGSNFTFDFMFTRKVLFNRSLTHQTLKQ